MACWITCDDKFIFRTRAQNQVPSSRLGQVEFVAQYRSEVPGNQALHDNELTQTRNWLYQAKNWELLIHIVLVSFIRSVWELIHLYQ